MSECEYLSHIACDCADVDGFPYPEPSTWYQPIFTIKADDGMLCTDRYCSCGIDRLAEQPNWTVPTAGSGDMFRWAPPLPALRFGPP